MKRIVRVAIAAGILVSMAFTHSVRSVAADRAPHIRMPGPTVQDLMLGAWTISVKYEPSTTHPLGRTGKGREVWRIGPGGRSLIEEYDEQGPEGSIHEFGIAWWDPAANGQRVLWCADDEAAGCLQVPDVARWEGDTLVHTVESGVGNKHLVHQEIFTDITATSFTQILKAGPSRAELKVTTVIQATRIPDRTKHAK